MTAAAVAPAATHRMLVGPVLPTLLRLATPNVIGLFATTVMIGFDGYVVGRLGADALAGVAMVLPLAMLMLQMSAGSLGGSTTAVVARALVLGLAVSVLYTLLATRPSRRRARGAWRAG